MSLPVKIAIGTLGGGTVAVGGYEALSYATGKPGLLFDHSVVEQSGEEGSTSPGESTEINENGQTTLTSENLTAEINKLKGKCDVQFKSTEDQAAVEVSGVTSIEETDISFIISKLKELASSDCSANSGYVKTVVFQKATSGTDLWTHTISPDLDAIKSLLNTLKTKCTIKIADSKTPSTEEDVTDQTAVATLVSLESEFKKLDGTGGDCETKGEKTIVFKKESGQSIWTKTVKESQTTISTNKSKIETKIKDWAGKCELKIQTSSGEDAKKLSDFLTDKDGDLAGLDTDLNTSWCDGTGNPTKEVVVQKDSSASKWVRVTTVDEKRAEIKKWIEDMKSKCTVKFKTKDSEDTTIDSKEKITDNKIDEIYGKVKQLKEGDCAGAASQGVSPAEKTFTQQQNDSWSLS